MMVGVGLLGVLIVIAVIVAIVMAMGTRPPAEDGVPRGFPWILPLLAIVVVAGIVTFIVVQNQPVNYVLEINVPSGKRFIGEVIVDGRSQPVQGERSGRLELTGKRISWVILIEDAIENDSIDVRLVGGGGGSSTNWGARGFAEKRFGGVGTGFTSINEDEWPRLMAEYKEPEQDSDALLPGFAAPSNPADGNDEADDSPDGQEESPDDASSDAEDGNDTPASSNRPIRDVPAAA